MAIKISGVSVQSVKFKPYVVPTEEPDETAPEGDGGVVWVTDNDLGSFTEGDNVSLQLVATNAVSFTGVNVPAGLTVSSSGLLSGILPATDYDRIFSFSVRANGETGYVQRTFLLQVLMSEAPTWVTPAGSLGSINEGTASSFSVSATHPDLTVSYASIGAMPNGWTLNPNTGAITGTGPGVLENKTFSFTIAASNPFDKSASRTFSITVNDTLGSTFYVTRGLNGNTARYSNNDGVTWSAGDTEGVRFLSGSNSAPTNSRLYRVIGINQRQRSSNGSAWTNDGTINSALNGRYLNGAWRITSINGSGTASRRHYDIAYNGSLWVASGMLQVATSGNHSRAGIFTASTYAQDPTSPNWTTAHTDTVASSSTIYFSQVVYYQGSFYVFGQAAESATYSSTGRMSSDGTTWTSFPYRATKALVVNSINGEMIIWVDALSSSYGRIYRRRVTTDTQVLNVAGEGPKTIAWNGLPMGEGGVLISGGGGGRVWKSVDADAATWAATTIDASTPYLFAAGCFAN